MPPTTFRLLCATALLALSATAGQAAPGEHMCAIARAPKCDVRLAVKWGMVQTGLKPVFPKGARCRRIDEAWAISYTAKRGREAYHGGIDIPAPFGTPIVAAADGEVVALFEGRNSYRGKEVVLRHSPAQTGLPFWTFTEYSHFKTMPRLRIGQKIRKGQVLGPTGNSGRGPVKNIQSTRRRPAIHFAVLHGPSPDFRISRNGVVVPKNARWTEPVAFLAGLSELDSYRLRQWPRAQKRVQVGVMKRDGTVLPAGARIVWPYLCR